MKKVWGVLVFVIFVSGVIFLSRNQTKTGQITSLQGQAVSAERRIGVLAKNLQVPWAIAFLPSGDLVFTQRGGEIKLIAKGTSAVTSVVTIDEVKQYGEGGLLGIAVSPKFSANNYIFVYYTYSSNGDDTKNRVVRYKFAGGKLSDRMVIVDAIPGAVFHNGGRIKFGPDGYLYITAGDSLNPSLAQDTNSLAGKILRIDESGKAAFGNPFGNRVYSYGHRNPQGLAWDSRGRLWETEHGNTATDEVNLIEPGKNYGWPDVRGDEKRNGMILPVVQSGVTTWAPSGAAIFDGNLFFAGLKGQGLFKISIDSPTLSQKVVSDLGRVREVVIGPDNLLYIATNNTDGRGNPGADDDKIIVLDPKSL
ncbi:MAG: PQQ-dependent sugar dehydrogenase [Candidatus Curtissbacteria bacterium]|nr:PQQ-dependent sugar dehydrogenase [Candidatus Curtissbacteria bacterium]